MQIGVAQGGTGNLQRDTQQLLQNFAQVATRNCATSGNAGRDTMGGRQGLTTPLATSPKSPASANTSTLSTTQLRDGSLLYMIGVAPSAGGSRSTTGRFSGSGQSLQIADR